MNGLINDAESKNLSLMNTAEIVKFMTETLREMSSDKNSQLMLFMRPSTYNKLSKYRFRKCRVKKGYGNYRYVLIGPPRLTLKVQK